MPSHMQKRLRVFHQSVSPMSLVVLGTLGSFIAGCGSSNLRNGSDGGPGMESAVDMAHGGVTLDPGIISKSSDESTSTPGHPER